MFAKIDYTSGIQDAFSKIATTVPKLISFLLVVIIGMIVARFITSIVKRLLKTAKFDQRMGKVGVEAYVARTGSSSSKLVAGAVRLLLMFVVWTTAFATFGPANPISKFLNSTISYMPKAIVAIVILGITAALARFVGDVVSRASNAAKFPPFVAKIAPIAIWVLGGFAAVDQLGVAANITHTLFQAMLAVLVGSAIVAIGGGGILPMRKQWEDMIARQQASKNAMVATPEHDQSWPIPVVTTES